MNEHLNQLLTEARATSASHALLQALPAVVPASCPICGSEMVWEVAGTNYDKEAGYCATCGVEYVTDRSYQLDFINLGLTPA